MTTPRDEIEERRIEQLLARLGRRTSAPPEHDLRAMARGAVAPRRPTSGSRRRRRWAHPLRWVGAAAAVALLVGSGVGFGLGSSFTSPEAARASFAGMGFIPARGWTVVQAGRADSTEPARAIAANVPLRAEDGFSAVPYATLESLPSHGVLIVATFTTRGDPGADFAYPVRTLPLQISNATLLPSGLVLPRPLAEYGLRAGIRGINVDARIYFGSGEVSPRMRAAAQRQLNGLVVASERVTLFARNTVIGPAAPVATVFGSVDNGRAGETVTVQAKDCGSQFFRALAETETHAGGGWSLEVSTGITSTIRAVWKDSASSQVTIRQQANVFFDRQRSGSGFRVGVGAKRSFWHKRVLIQRRQGGAWKTAKTVVLTDSAASSGTLSWTESTFGLSVPNGTLVRAVLPLSQARPCYIAGISRTVRA